MNDLETGMANWAVENRLETVIGLRPFTGLLADRLPAITAALADRGIRLVLIQRPADVAAMSGATAGFFKFREKTASLRQG